MSKVSLSIVDNSQNINPDGSNDRQFDFGVPWFSEQWVTWKQGQNGKPDRLCFSMYPKGSDWKHRDDTTKRMTLMSYIGGLPLIRKKEWECKMELKGEDAPYHYVELPTVIDCPTCQGLGKLYDLPR
jgi:hypothetical protein